MTCDLGNQRWRDRRDSYRPRGEPIRTHLYDIAPIPGDAEARSFVERHHYSGSYPAARRRFGLYRAGDLVGVAVFSVPCNAKVIAALPGGVDRSVELGRFVLLDEVPANGETWFLARTFECLAREGFRSVVSFSDPCPRHAEDGRTIFPGHIGTIYQAANGVYHGRGTPRTLRLLPDGRVLSSRAISKIRSGDQGWRYAAAQLVAFGADDPGDDLRSWLACWLPVLTRPFRHPGNFKYSWAFRRADRRTLTLTMPSLDYPKRIGA